VVCLATSTKYHPFHLEGALAKLKSSIISKHCASAAVRAQITPLRSALFWQALRLAASHLSTGLWQNAAQAASRITAHLSPTMTRLANQSGAAVCSVRLKLFSRQPMATKEQVSL